MNDDAVAISIFELFSIGIGPSSSHTVGPMRAARTFAQGLAEDGLLADVARVRVELFGSLGATGRGHGSDRAVILGLEGERPETIETSTVAARAAAVRESGRIVLLGRHEVALSTDDLVLHRRQTLRFHPTACASTPTTPRTSCAASGRSTPSAAASWSTSRLPGPIGSSPTTHP